MPLVIGLMSGTSVDGVDAALVDISRKSKNELRIKLIDWSITPYPVQLKKKNFKSRYTKRWEY
ncbi:MAG: anhydro-N-acetylmuramic acid kinase [Deltaproteobacteria bacterium]|nr:MAG: anhydro-N-acetylmuramic acid kinase [Deltaproteobacteria bacterium]